MEIPKTYDPKGIENKWYGYWMENKFFRSVPDDRQPYTIVIPPPNVTGVLHMGHMLNNTIQDVLIRKARMEGKNACWVPGTDHASIATEAKVVAMLAGKGIRKSDLSREEFLKYAWEWKEKYGGIILEQLKKLGASCDWDRTAFTMAPELSEAVIDVFIDLYNKGQIYRGIRMVNWDPKGLTAISDEEVVKKEEKSKLYYIRYKIEGSDNEWITIATTRPETILGDTAICVHPEDERYKHLKGKHAVVPFVERRIPIIFDDYVEREFGTGALKVTPAHDMNDYMLGQKHKLETIDILNDNGTLSGAAQLYVGQDRFAVRKKITKDLQEGGYLVKIDEITNNVGYSERNPDTVIEPRLSMQWFLKMEEISKPALENVLNGNVKLIPDKFINTYRHWMENVRDWCISRQLWWGQRIPAWYDQSGEFVVCRTKEEAVELFKKKGMAVDDPHQDDDVVDTWFSSWLWPISVFDTQVFRTGKPNEELKYYYPTNDLVTAPEILFFWVARMIIAGYEYLGEKPFSNVYLTGIVRDRLGRKMSKQFGNSPDPLDLMEVYSADAVRFGVLFPSPAGNDIMFDTPLEITEKTPLESKYCEQGSKFTNKIWNALRLVKSWEVDKNLTTPEVNRISMEWFEARFNERFEVIMDDFDKYRLSDALKDTYSFVWDDFCSWYLEMVKPEFGKPIDEATYNKTIGYFEEILKLLHPFVPFVTEEIWSRIREREAKDCVIVAKWPKGGSIDAALLEKFSVASEVITNIRNLRKQKNISPNDQLQLIVKASAPSRDFDGIIAKLGNLSGISYAAEKPEGALSFVTKAGEYFIPFSEQIDVKAERERIKKELEYNKGFLKSVQAKLANERFVANAKPEVVEMERRKQADAESKIKALEEQLEALK
jgi:valyl-tRNA synthetase